jgi:hypothetical protein
MESSSFYCPLLAAVGGPYVAVMESSSMAAVISDLDMMKKCRSLITHELEVLYVSESVCVGTIRYRIESLGKVG